MDYKVQKKEQTVGLCFTKLVFVWGFCLLAFCSLIDFINVVLQAVSAHLPCMEVFLELLGCRDGRDPPCILGAGF